jgi:hypothetical protein
MSGELAGSTKEPAPLTLSYFADNSESFSAEVVRELRQSQFFRPKLRSDGTPSDKDMLLLASSVIAASDRELRVQRARLAGLEAQAGWWNSPMFQPARVSKSGEPEAADTQGKKRKLPGFCATSQYEILWRHWWSSQVRSGRYLFGTRPRRATILTT